LALRTAISYRFVGWLQDNGDVFAIHIAGSMLCLGLNFVQVPLKGWQPKKCQLGAINKSENRIGKMPLSIEKFGG
ncbi:hypothetical protein QUA62_26830, partial [Microcoleus sp. MON1_C1]|uniref:hypothetical protein n=1 Tax=Microcoleus sp. MON1_C1 TaxID=2818827 RepID=UPI002FD02AC3